MLMKSEEDEETEDEDEDERIDRKDILMIKPCILIFSVGEYDR